MRNRAKMEKIYIWDKQTKGIGVAKVATREETRGIIRQILTPFTTLDPPTHPPAPTLALGVPDVLER